MLAIAYSMDISKEYQIKMVRSFTAYPCEGRGEIIYCENAKELHLEGSLVASSRKRVLGFLSLCAVFGRFNPPYDDEVIDDFHWDSIALRLGQEFNAKVTLNRSGGKLREDIWRVYLDGSVKGVYRWHDRGKEIDLQKVIHHLEDGHFQIEVFLEPHPKWLDGSQVTSQQFARMKSCIAEMRENVRFTDKT